MTSLIGPIEVHSTAADQSKKWDCTWCRKEFRSESAYDHHIQSRKHLAKEAARTGALVGADIGAGIGAGIGEGTSVTPAIMENGAVVEDSGPLKGGWGVDSVPGITACLFCPETFKAPQSCLDHMTTKHSLFLPEIDSCINVVGLLEFLGEIIADDRECLYCGTSSGHSFPTVQAVQHHMMAKSHCKIFSDDVTAWEDLAPFYDFSDPSNTKDAEIPEELKGVPRQMLQDKPEATDLFWTTPTGRTLSSRSLGPYLTQAAIPRDPSSVPRLPPRLLELYREKGWDTKGQLTLRAQQAMQAVRKGTTGNGNGGPRHWSHSGKSRKDLSREQGLALGMGMKQNGLFVRRPQVIF